MVDLKLTAETGPDGKPIVDVDVTDGDLSLVEGLEAVAQDLAITLRTFLTESVYDRNAGVPYIQIIFQPGTTNDAIVFILENIIKGRPHVDDVLELTPERDERRRRLTITGRVSALGKPITFGPIEVSA